MKLIKRFCDYEVYNAFTAYCADIGDKLDYLDYIKKGSKSIGKIFLAGINANADGKESCFNNSWRKEFCDSLENQIISFASKINEFDEDQYVEVFIPELEDEDRFKDLDSMTKEEAKKLIDKYHEWEIHNMEKSDIVSFWIPRYKDKGMNGYTTNIEFGYMIGKDPNKVILGYPDDAQNMEYIDKLYHLNKVCPITTHTINNLALHTFIKLFSNYI